MVVVIVIVIIIILLGDGSGTVEHGRVAHVFLPGLLDASVLVDEIINELPSLHIDQLLLVHAGLGDETKQSFTQQQNSRYNTT